MTKLGSFMKKIMRPWARLGEAGGEVGAHVYHPSSKAPIACGRRTLIKRFNSFSKPGVVLNLTTPLVMVSYMGPW